MGAGLVWGNFLFLVFRAAVVYAASREYNRIYTFIGIFLMIAVVYRTIDDDGDPHHYV